MMFLSIPKLLTKPGASKEDQQRYVAEKLAHALDRPDVIGMSKEERIKLGMEL